jgi:recombination protein RecT
MSNYEAVAAGKARSQDCANWLNAQVERLRGVQNEYLDASRAVVLAKAVLLKVPTLALCSRDTLYRCLSDVVALGLEPGREAHLIPREERKNGNPTGHWYCTLIVDYKGLIAVALRSENIQAIEARVVFKRDKFEYTAGDNESIVHVPYLGSDANRDPGDVLCAYAIAHLANGRKMRDVMTLNELRAIRHMSSNANGDNWTDPYKALEMMRKCPVRRLFKYLPFPPKLKPTIELLDEQEREIVAEVGATEVPTEAAAPALSPPSRADEIAQELAAMAGKPAPDPVEVRPAAPTPARPAPRTEPAPPVQTNPKPGQAVAQIPPSNDEDIPF